DSIRYGGSVKAGNASEIFACDDVDGGVVGGASLVAADFIQIIKALKSSISEAPYHIVITRRKHLLLNFLKIKVIVNGTEIYPIAKGEKLVIPVKFNNPKIVATDGYHITQPLELVFHHIHRYHFKIVCVIGDSQLAAGFV